MTTSRTSDARIAARNAAEYRPVLKAMATQVRQQAKHLSPTDPRLAVWSERWHAVDRFLNGQPDADTWAALSGWAEAFDEAGSTRPAALLRRSALAWAINQLETP